MADKRVIGLTGGIGVGKSTVAEVLGELGAEIVDCDELGRQVVEPNGLAYDGLIAAFGREILQPDGLLDRPKLGSVVFNNAEKLGTLNAITHPAIDTEIAASIDRAVGHPVILDMAVLTESNLGKGQYGEVIVVEAPLEARLERLATNRGMTEEQAMARINSQATDGDRRAIADYLITNDNTETALRNAVVALWEQARFGGEPGA